MRYFSVILLLAIFFSADAQNKIDFVDVDEIIANLSTAVDQKDFDALIKGIDKVPKNDSLYCGLLVSKSYYLMQTERYEESLKVYEEAKELGCEEQLRQIKINQSVLYLRKGDFENSLKVSEEILKESPYNTNALYNRALVLEKLNRPKESLLAFQELLRINPLEPDVHLQLGVLCYKRGLTAQALLAFNTWMLLSDDVNSDIEQLSSLNKSSFTPYDGDAFTYKLSDEDKSFSTIDKILDQGLALQNSYDTGNKIDLQLVRQNHILFTYLKDHTYEKGTWSSIYVPIYRKIMEDDNFNEFTYYLTQSLKDSEYKSIYKRNQKDALEIARALVVDLLETASKSDREKQYHYENGTLQGIGKTINDEPVGDYVLLDDSGYIISKGSFNDNGEQDGEWLYFHRNGKVREMINYSNGLKTGINSGYFASGQKSYELNYLNGEATGEYKRYNESGALLIKKQLVNGKNDGDYEGYFDIGEDAVEYMANYKDDKIDGILKEYYSDGTLYKETTFNKYQKNGVERTYNADGLKIAEINYLNDELNGTYITYHNNGNVEQESVLKNGYYIGTSTSYHYNNEVAIKRSYNSNGKLDGVYQEYTDDGKLWYEYDYSNGKINSFKYFNKKGEVLSEGRKRGGDLDFAAYSPNGLLFITGIYDSRDGKKGNWKYYDANTGYLKNEGKYVDDKAVGLHLTYHANGVIMETNEYEMGKIVGYGAYYFPDGNIEVQGYFKEGERQGSWETYYEDGTIQSKSYYHKGELINWKEYYDVTGSISLKELYKNNELKKEIFFKSNGDELFSISYPLDPDVTQRRIINEKGGVNYVYEIKNGVYHGAFTSYVENGTILSKGNYVNGKMHGTWEWFHPNGKVEVIKYYKLNRSHGPIKGFYEDGTLEYEFEYVYDKRHGTYTSYHENGAIDTSSNYVFDELHGERKQYDHLGNLQIIRTYDHGAFIGYSFLNKNGEMVDMIPVEKETASVTSYYQSGQVSREYELKNDDIQGQYKTYFENGKLSETTDYVNGIMEGEEVEYYPNGNVKLKTMRLKGKKHGVEVSYYPSGNKKMEIEFLNGKKHGSQKFYNLNGELTNTQQYINDKLQFN